VSSDKDRELIGAGRKIEQFEIENYTPLIAEGERLEFTHKTALLTSILNQEKLANELLGVLAQGKGPLDKLLKKVLSNTRAPSRRSFP
jgi:ferritin-like metal-binding protein YciE